MKILVVAHEPNFSGGANRSLFTNLKILKNEYKNDLLVLIPSSKGEFRKKLDEENISWIATKYYGVISGIQNDGKDWLRYLKVYIGYYLEKYKAFWLIRKLKSKKIDVVYTNTRLPIIGAFIAKGLKVPHVVHVREIGSPKPLWGKWGYKEMYSLSTRIILISNALKEKFEEYVPSDKLIVSHNGIDYLSQELKEKKLSNTINLLVTGRLVPDKGHIDAINALKEIIQSKSVDKKIILNIAGSAPKASHINWYERKIKSLVKEYGLQENVVFHGEVADMHSLRKKMDIELVCSICETFGRVTVEAMRSGLVVIGTNTGGTPEIIKDKSTGLLYNQGDYIDLAQKICFLINDEQKYTEYRNNAYIYSKNNFTKEKNCEEIMNIINSVIK